MIALGAMQAFQAQGWKIPDDISIVGFDDITFSAVFSPGLTTVKVYKKELGQVAVRRMIELLRERPVMKIRTQLVNELVIRGSVTLPGKIEEAER
jgi:LacI family transcriptional regulator